MPTTNTSGTADGLLSSQVRDAAADGLALAVPTYDWGIEQVDVGAYLARLGASAPSGPPDAATLTALHRARRGRAR